MTQKSLRLNSKLLQNNRLKLAKGSIVEEKIPHFKVPSKALNITLKYGMSSDFPFQNANTLVHPATKVNIVDPRSKLLN